MVGYGINVNGQQTKIDLNLSSSYMSISNGTGGVTIGSFSDAGRITISSSGLGNSILYNSVISGKSNAGLCLSSNYFYTPEIQTGALVTGYMFVNGIKLDQRGNYLCFSTGDGIFTKDVLLKSTITDSGVTSSDYATPCVSTLYSHTAAFGWDDKSYLHLLIDGKTYWCSGTFSDERTKKNISDIENIKNIYLDFSPKKYKYKDIGLVDSGKYHTGLIAQDIIQTFENNGLNAEEYDLVYTVDNKNDLVKGFDSSKSIYRLNYENLHALHIAFSKEFYYEYQDQIQKLKNRVAELETKLQGEV